MPADAFLSVCFWCFASLVGLIALVQRRRVKKGRPRFGFYPSGAMLGNALQQLQAIAEPPMQHAVVEMMDEDEADEDDTGGPDTARKARRHLLRQAARIRRGEELERLTTLLGDGS